MYNEGDDLCSFAMSGQKEHSLTEFADTSTMYGVQKNIQHLCSRTRSKTWGADAWKKVSRRAEPVPSIESEGSVQVVVVIVSDGRKKINSRTLSVLAAQGIYQDGIAKNVVNGKPVTCHVS